MGQLTTESICKQKRTYGSKVTAYRAVKRRNKAAGYKYLRQYKCNVCELWHVTTQSKEEVSDLQASGVPSQVEDTPRRKHD